MNKEILKISSININVGGKEIVLTFDEARELFLELLKLFPVYNFAPTNPSPWMPMIPYTISYPAPVDKPKYWTVDPLGDEYIKITS